LAQTVTWQTKSNILKEQRPINKKLEKALKAGRVADTKKYILEGAAISFLNFDGVLCAAEDGKYKVIEMILIILNLYL
jgi:hypothetical protein